MATRSLWFFRIFVVYFCFGALVFGGKLVQTNGKSVRTKCKRKKKTNRNMHILANSSIFFCGNFIGMSAVNRQKCWNELYCWHSRLTSLILSLSLPPAIVPFPIVGPSRFCIRECAVCYVLQILCIFNRRVTYSKWMRTNARTTHRPTNQITSDHPT